MKKLLAASVLALAVLAGVQQPASAWCHFKFGVGLNMEFSSGNNSMLWGLHKSGQVPEGMGGPVGGEFYAPAPQSGGTYPAAAGPTYAGGFAPGNPATYAAYYAGNYYPANYAGYYPANNYAASYPASYPANYYQPSSYYHLATYPSNYPTNYYLMSNPSSSGAINFYGN